MYFSQQEWIDIFLNVFIFIFVIYGNEFIVRSFKKFRKPNIREVQPEWYDLKEFPIPDEKDLINRELILCSENKLYIKKYEDLIHIQQEKHLITHWRYAPIPVIVESNIFKED